MNNHNQTKKNKRSAYLLFAILLILLAAIAAAIAFYGRDTQKNGAKAETSRGEDTGLEEGQAVHNGMTYEYNRDLKTVLFLGVDKKDGEFTEHSTGWGGQADCILLFILDPEKKVATTLQISRDTMTDIDIYDVNGDIISTEKGQITLQYAYGDGKARSCRLMEQAVSRLLYGVDIDGYFAMNLDGFSKATDLAGGVEIVVPEDYTAIDPAFQKGAVVTLDGALAEKYVRSRDITVTGSNDGRMERQTQFLEALAQKMTKSGGNADSYIQIFTELQDYLVTDMSADDLAELSDYEFARTVKVPGETRAGEEHDEYHIDENALYELILELFYVPVQ